jgi:hypothetical protein
VGVVIAALLAGSIVSGAVAANVLGSFAIVAVIALAWVLIPSASTLSRRLALNGAIGLGAIPLLWWLPFSSTSPIGRVGVLLGITVAVVVFLALFSHLTRSSLRPTTSRVDLVPAAAAGLSLWFFWPFLVERTPTSALAMLIQGFGGDNVAHFTMFSMVRRLSAAGPLWPTAPDGTVFAYTVYPQHFHVLAAGVGEALAGTALGSPAAEAALFSLSTSVVLGVAFITLASAISSLTALRARPALSAVATAAAAVFLFLGVGGSHLIYGFPPFVLAIIATLIASVIAAENKPPSLVTLGAVAAAVVLTAHSWMLLAPVALAAMLVVFLRIPWLRRGYSVRGRVTGAIIIVASASAVCFGGWLVFEATRAAGGPVEALSTFGGVTPPPLRFTLALTAAVLAFAGFILLQFLRSRGSGRHRQWTFAAATGATVGVAFLLAIVLVAVQLAQADGLSYFQYKFISSLLLVVLVLGVVLLCCVLADRPAPSAGRAVLEVGLAALVAVGLAAGSGVNPNHGSFPGLAFRSGITASANNPSEGIERLVTAAEVMAVRPCVRPFYLAVLPGDQSPGVANQWAMALSGTWTERASELMTLLFSLPSDTNSTVTELTVSQIMSNDPESCVVVAPEVFEALSPDFRAELGSRIFSW